MKKIIYLVVLMLFVSCNLIVDKAGEDNLKASANLMNLRVVEHKSNTVKLEWDYKGPNPYCFRILRSIDDPVFLQKNIDAPEHLRKFATIAKLDSASRTYVDETVKPGENPEYIIRMCRDEHIGYYSNEVNAGSKSGISAPKLDYPIQVAENIQLSWESQAALLGEIVSFKIIRKKSIEEAGVLAGTVDAELGKKLYTFIDSNLPESNVYYLYQIEGVSGAGISAASEIKGTPFGIVNPGVITNFRALMLSSGDSIASKDPNPRDVVLEWSYSGSECIFVISMAGTVIRQINSTDPNSRARGSGGGFMARVPYSILSHLINAPIVFSIYPKTSYNGEARSATVNPSVIPTLNTANSSLTVTGTSPRITLTLNHNYAQNGFITAYSVQRKDCGQTFTSCNDCGAEINIYNRRDFISGGANPSFNEYWGSRSPSLQRVEGNTYCYSFTLYNGYSTASTPWQNH